MQSKLKHGLWLLMGLVALVAAGTLYFFPTSSDSREIAAARSLAGWAPSEVSPVLGAAEFCRAWTKLPTESVDCRTGYAISSLQPAFTNDLAAAWQSGMASAESRLDLLKSMSAHMAARQDKELAVKQPLFALELRLEIWNERYRMLSNVDIKNPELVAHYPVLFQLLLDVNGQNYNALNNQFRHTNWNVIRLADPQSRVLSRAESTASTLSWAPWLLCLTAGFLCFLAYWRAQLFGIALIVVFIAICWLGLLIVADAAVRFGEGSSIFPLNPLGNQLPLQMRSFLIASVTLSALALWPWHIETLISLATRNVYRVSLLLLIGTVLLYVGMGPAMGSESLKISMAVVAGLMTAAYGRPVHLASHYASEALKPLKLIRTWNLGKQQSLDPINTISALLNKPVMAFTGFMVVSTGLAALAFNDFGAALVTTAVAVAAVYFVFGSKIVSLVLLLLIGVASALSQTDKVQSRIALMLDPLNAAVSDFARLQAFSNAAHQEGFPLGEMAWCSGSGVCIPLQALSDYMPVVLNGVWGAYGTLAYFVAFLIALLALGTWFVRQYLTSQGAIRAMAMIGFYLLLGTAIQTIVTFFGNWRLMPLTGLGTPLLSIGLSSLLAPSIVVGLALGIRFTTSHKTTP